MSKPQFTAEQDDFIRAHYKQGMSTARIARHLGITKNSVVGRAGRLGLSSPGDDPVKRKKKSFWTNKRAMEMGPHIRHHVEAQPLVNLRAQADGVRFRGCQWIEGLPSADDACKCGEPPVTGSPYCQEHFARAYQLKAA